MTKLIDRNANGTAIDDTLHDANMDIMAGINVVDATTAITITSTHQNATVEMTSASAKAVTLDLLSTLRGSLSTSDFWFILHNSGAGTATITCNVADSINGGTTSTTVVLLENEFVKLHTANVATEWNVINKGFDLATLTTNQTISGDKAFTGNNTFSGTSTFNGASPLIFEGATADAFETTFTITDPTADRTITFPDTTGTVALVGTSGIIQTVGNSTGAVATGTTIFPADDTIPQNTEGDQYLSQAITPTSATNIIEVEVVAYASHSAAGSRMSGALFSNQTAHSTPIADSIATAQVFGVTATLVSAPVVIKYRAAAGTTSATTFTVRLGSASVGTTTFNGESGARLYGGSFNSSITIREVTP